MAGRKLPYGPVELIHVFRIVIGYGTLRVGAVDVLLGPHHRSSARSGTDIRPCSEHGVVIDVSIDVWDRKES